MPRRSRLSLPNVPLHIIQRGNNRQPCFLRMKITAIIRIGGPDTPINPDKLF